MFPLKERKIGGYKFGQKTWYSAHHLGVDYVAKKGTELYAPFDGEVIKKFWGVQGGNTIWFKPTGQNVIIRFMHLSDFVGGGEVKSGQVIGHTGNTGATTTGAHLHLDISKGNVNIWDFNNFLDPEKYDWKDVSSNLTTGTNGIDISHYQKINWKNVNTEFVISKCTESTTFFDPTFDANKTACRTKGIRFGGYHFARGTDAIKEANYFVNHYGQVNKEDILALDYEIKLKDPAPWCKTFLERVENITGVKPYIYINSSTATGFNWTPCLFYPLWIANYGNNDGTRHKAPKIGRWDKYAIHQYTSKGKIVGIVGNVDLDYMA